MVRTTLILSLVLVASSAYCADQAPDPVCSELWNRYVNGVKINGDLVDASMTVVAYRGRTNGFWKVVYDDLYTKKPNAERQCVRVLGDMLAEESVYLLKNQNPKSGPRARSIQLVLPPTVVNLLVDRAMQADRFMTRPYLDALRGAMADEGSVFYHNVMNEKMPDTVFFDDRFIAAVALAQIADADGYQWLVDHSGDQDTFMFRPSLTYNDHVGACCSAVLRELSDETFATKEEWTKWWSTIDHTKLSRHRVTMSERM